VFLHAGPGMARLAGLGIARSGLGLMSSLPIPFSNSLPAWAAALVAVGLMGQDGLLVLLATWPFIGLTGALSFKGLDKLLETF
jgi:hypothetical protein